MVASSAYGVLRPLVTECKLSHDYTCTASKLGMLEVSHDCPWTFFFKSDILSGVRNLFVHPYCEVAKRNEDIFILKLKNFYQQCWVSPLRKIVDSAACKEV